MNRDSGQLLVAGTVLTMNEAREVVRDGAVLVRGADIVGVGRVNELATAHPTAERIELGADAVLLPGFVNTHTHLFQTLLKGLGDDRSLHRWLVEMTIPAGAVLTAEDCDAAASHGAIEAIRSGCTTVVDFMYVHPKPRLTDAVIAGLEAVGLRAIVARGFVTRGGEQGVPPVLMEDLEAALNDCVRLAEAHRAHPRISVAIAPCLLWMVDEEALRATRRLADEHGMLMTYHLAETSFESAYAAQAFGRSEVEFLEGIGFLGPDLLAVHCTKLTGADIQVMARHDVKVSHNPVSNMYLAAGVAPIPTMLRAGLTVGLATDGPASNNNQNMLEVLKATALLHKVSTEDPEIISAATVLEMATIGGARAIGMEHEIGSLEVGKRADLAAFALDNVFATPVHDPVSSLVYATTGCEAKLTMVDGRILMRDGELVSTDESSVLERSRQAALGLARRAGISTH